LSPALSSFCSLRRPVAPRFSSWSSGHMKAPLRGVRD
jgi:hypothetical protein